MLRGYPKTFLLFLLFIISASLVPPKLEMGASTAAYQIEGAWLEDGKGMHIWDSISHSGQTMDGESGDIAADSYHKFPEDIALMKLYNIKHFRMSISWARIIPSGRAGSPINQKGIDHYLKVFTSLLQAGVTPYVTLYHWDLPSMMVITGDGYADPDFVDDFAYYAETCFKYFGHLVKYWFTFNEPWCTVAFETYQPQDEATKPYIAAHNIILAHAKASYIYRRSFKTYQKGYIGIVLNSEFYYPKNPQKKEDIEAARRCLDFQLGWFADPIFLGDYPKVMREIVGDRLPKFTAQEKLWLTNSADFFALNNYFSVLAEPWKTTAGLKASYWSDRHADTSYDPNWVLTDNGWPIVPQGMHDLLLEINSRYMKASPRLSEAEIMITENGVVLEEKTIKDSLSDIKRVDFYNLHLNAVLKAIQEGAKVTKFFAWALVDDFEWGAGYVARFGLTRVIEILGFFFFKCQPSYRLISEAIQRELLKEQLSGSMT